MFYFMLLFMTIWEKSHKGMKFKKVTSNLLFRSNVTEDTGLRTTFSSTAIKVPELWLIQNRSYKM